MPALVLAQELLLLRSRICCVIPPLLPVVLCMSARAAEGGGSSRAARPHASMTRALSTLRVRDSAFAATAFRLQIMRHMGGLSRHFQGQLELEQKRKGW